LINLICELITINSNSSPYWCIGH